MCHPERSRVGCLSVIQSGAAEKERRRVIGGKKADAFGNKLPWACAHMPPIAAHSFYPLQAR